MGIYEETFVLIPLILSSLFCMGEKKIAGGYAVILGSCAGVAASTVNPYTVGIASEIAGVSVWDYKMLLFRCMSLVLFCLAGLLHLKRYITADRLSVILISDKNDVALRNDEVYVGVNRFSVLQKKIVCVLAGTLASALILVYFQSYTMNRMFPQKELHIHSEHWHPDRKQALYSV